MSITPQTSISAIESDIKQAKLRAIFGTAVIIATVILLWFLFNSGNRIVAAIAVFPCLFAVAESIRALRGWKNTNARVNKFRKYISIITTQDKIYIDQIAHIIGVPVDDALADLQHMVDRKYFTNAHIDALTYTIVFDSPTKAGNGKDDSSAQDLNSISITCKSCGAVNNVPKGSAGIRCEYCNSTLTHSLNK